MELNQITLSFQVLSFSLQTVENYGFHLHTKQWEQFFRNSMLQQFFNAKHITTQTNGTVFSWEKFHRKSNN